MLQEKKSHDGVQPSHAAGGEVNEGVTAETGPEYDAVFGKISEDGPNYRNVGWIGTTALMMKTQIGLGVLSLPAIFNTMGLILGIILVLLIAGITTWAQWIVGVFKLRHPDVYGIDSIGRLFFGRIGYETFGAAFCLLFTFGAESAMLSISIALNALSGHGACTAVFVAVAAITGFLFSSIQTLGRVSWLARLGAACIIISVLIVTIGVGIQGHPTMVDGQNFESDYKLLGTPSFTETVSAISTIIFTYAGAPGFFNIVAEMRDPRLYTRAVVVCQSTVTCIYISVATVVYYYCGSHVASPALGSAGPTIKKISYGIALPGLTITGVLCLHLSAKHIFVRILRGSEHLNKNTKIHYITWLSCTFTVTLVAYIVASGIPVFGGLVSLIGAIFGTFLTFQPMGGMWLYDNWKSAKENPTWGWRVGVAWSGFIIVAGSVLMVAGTYGSIASIIESTKADGGFKAWTCADNSSS